MPNMQEAHEQRLQELEAARDAASSVQDDPSLEELTEEAKAEREAREAQEAEERELYGEIVGNLREAAKRERELRRVDEGGTQHTAAQERVESILEALPEDWRENAQQRIDYDALREQIDHNEELVRERWSYGNPFKLVERAARRAVKIGYANYADQPMLDQINAGEYNGQWLGVTNEKGEWTEAVVPDRPDSRMAKGLFDALHKLRMAASAETARYAEQRRNRDERIADLGNTTNDVQAVLNGENAEVAGYFPWDSRGRTIRAYIDVRGTSSGIEILESDEFSNIEGDLVDESHPARKAVEAALLRLREELPEGEGSSSSQPGPRNELEESRKRSGRPGKIRSGDRNHLADQLEAQGIEIEGDATEA